MARKDRRPRSLPPRTPSPQALEKAEKYCALVRDSAPGGPYVAPPQAVEQIRTWAGEGRSIAWIAQALKINHETLGEIRKRQPEVDEAICAGKAINEDRLRDVIQTAAQGGNVIAAMFLLKAKHGWREGTEREPAAVSVGVQIIQMPGAAPSVEAYEATLPPLEPAPPPSDEDGPR